MCGKAHIPLASAEKLGGFDSLSVSKALIGDTGLTKGTEIPSNHHFSVISLTCGHICKA